MSAIRAIPIHVQPDAGSIVIFQGPPNVAVLWSVLGNGFLLYESMYTEENGIAHAKLIPTGDPGDEITVTVSYGA